MRAALAITVAVLVVEVAGAFVSGSLALLADAAHMFTDVAALLLSYGAMALAARTPTQRHTFGFYRAEILAAFVNAELLLVLSLYILYQSAERFLEPPRIETGIMLGVAVVGLAANIAALTLLHGGRRDSLNVKAAYLEVLADLVGSIGVIVAAITIARTGWLWMDAAVSGALALFILPRTVSLLRQSAHILLEGAPIEVDLEALRARILAIPGVEELHDLHFWTLTSGLHSASVHIGAAAASPRGEVLKTVQALFRDLAGVEHATIQVEWGTEIVCTTTRKL